MSRRSSRIPKAYITRFFQLIAERRITEADRILQRIKDGMSDNPIKEWDQGYLKALNGILLLSRSGNDKYSLMANLDIENKEEIKRHRRDILKITGSSLYADYDHGFFSAWSDFLRVLIRTGRLNRRINEGIKESPEEDPR